MEDANDPIFDEVIDAYTEKGMKDVMGFEYNWNEEIIAQFHASFFFNTRKNEVLWTTLGIHYCIDYMTFSRLLALGSKDPEHDTRYVENKIKEYDLGELYEDPRMANGTTHGLSHFFTV